MGTHYLKKASKTPETETSNAQQVVVEMLAHIEKMANLQFENTQNPLISGLAILF